MNLLCWEGYEADNILGEFSRRQNIQCSAKTLLSDAATAHALLQREREFSHWDVLNINNPWCRDFLCHHGVIHRLSEDRFAHTLDNLLPEFDRLSHWARNDSGELIGVCQRFGAFNLVVNTDRIDSRSAIDQGFNLANSPGQRYGILAYDDFNIFHICIGAGINPFEKLGAAELQKFSDTAQDWHTRAQLLSDDHNVLNRALAEGDIDFYISGGTYTVAHARLAGQNKLQAITPAHGSINGLGGVVFAEITSVLQRATSPESALEFLEYIVQPGISYRAATTPNTLNPVSQMGNPEVLRRFSTEQLDAMQWETLSEDIARCAMYQIPPDHRALQKRLQAARRDTFL
jgi:spermidine/putrescine transport system substrate-binding protein